MLILNEINETLLDKNVFTLFKKKLKIEYLFYWLNTNYKISNNLSGRKTLTFNRYSFL